MMRKIIAVFISTLFVSISFSQELSLKRGMVIRKTSKIKKGTYAIDAYESPDKSAIIIEGNNIVVDFNKAILKGCSGKMQPDQFFGTAIIVRKGKNITIKNLIAKGYKVALVAKGIDGLKIDNCDFSYNFRSNLNKKEDERNWEATGMKLDSCNQAIVANCKVTGGQSALTLSKCNNGQFYNNEFSFNSGVGISMTQCCNNRVLFNKLNFNVGSEVAAGIEIYTHSDNNIFYKNSVTHCGKGLTLHGVNSILGIYLSSEGNRIWSNDFSYSPGSGIETSSLTSFIYDNRIYECEQGILGRIVLDASITNNKFRKNDVAINIERGHHINIEGNIFQSDREAIKLGKAGGPDRIDTMYANPKSEGYTIHLNSFNQNPVVYHITRTDSVRIYNNRYSYIEELFRIDSTVKYIDSLPVEAIDTAMGFPFIKNPANPFKGSGRFTGRDKIMMTDWGPYDFQYPFIWNTNPPDSSGFMNFDVMGPKGKWKIVSSNGVELTGRDSDTLPSRFSCQVLGKVQEVELVLEFTGPAFTDQFGNRIPANKPYRFVFKKSR